MAAELLFSRDVREMAGGVSSSTLNRWCANPDDPLPYVKDSRGRRRYDRDAVVAYLPRVMARFDTSKANPHSPNGSNRRVRLALDIHDLAHLSGRGDVTEELWARVCRGNFQSWPPTQKTRRRALERWKRCLRDMRIPFRLVDDLGEPFKPRDGYHEAARMRFDWPAVLRWVSRVLD